MKKALSIALVICLFATLLTGCGDNKPNTAPVITGVNATASVHKGEDFNALAGVTASDAEDGNLTSGITVTSVPSLTFTNGVAAPSTQGTYELTYSVKDKAGEEAKEYCTLTVTAAVATETEFLNYEFPDTPQVDLKGWGAMADAANATGAVVDGQYVIDVQSIGTLSYEVKFGKTDFAVQAGTKYELKFYMRTDAPADKKFHILFEDAGNPAWAPETGSLWNENLLNTWKAYKYSFKASADSTQFNIILEMGKIDGDTITEPFKIYIEKIEIFSGELSGDAIYTDDFSTGISAMTFSHPQGEAGATLAAVDGTAELTIIQNTANEWEFMVFEQTNVNVVKDKDYKLVCTISSTAEFNYQLCAEDKVLGWQSRALFSAGSVNGDKTIDVFFKSLADVENIAVVFYLGKNTSTGKIVFDEIKLIEIDENASLDKEMLEFHPYGKTTEFDCFNGTDENLETGIGSMYMKDGKMFYHIALVGGTDYFNKIFTNTTTLDAMALYRFEITVKANTDLKCWFLLNKKGGYDPRITEYFTITDTAQKFSFNLTQMPVVDTDYEMVFSFGFPENTGKGDLTVEFSEIKIIKLATE